MKCKKETLNQIRSKYEGTAEEHDLLRSLCEDERDQWERAEYYKEVALKQLEEREQSSKQRADALEAIEDGNHVDRAIYCWQQEGCPPVSDTGSWSAMSLIDALRGRGMNADKLNALAKQMQEIETAEQDAKNKVENG